MFFGHNLARSTNVASLSAGSSAGTGQTVTSTALNMDGDMGVMFIVALGTVASGGAGLIKVQASMDNGVADPYTDVAGSGQLYTSSNSTHVFVVDIARPQKQYLQVQVVETGSGNTTIQSIVAVTYHLAVAPETPGTNVDGVVWLSNPGPGAA